MSRYNLSKMVWTTKLIIGRKVRQEFTRRKIQFDPIPKLDWQLRAQERRERSLVTSRMERLKMEYRISSLNHALNHTAGLRPFNTIYLAYKRTPVDVADAIRNSRPPANSGYWITLEVVMQKHDALSGLYIRSIDGIIAGHKQLKEWRDDFFPAVDMLFVGKTNHNFKPEVVDILTRRSTA